MIRHANWYVRRSRERFWAKGMEQDKINAYMTLYTCLTEICKAAAPMVPFMTEEIYQNMVRSVDPSAKDSIHLCDYPTVKEEYIDKELESNMDEVLKMVVLGRAGRNEANIKNRQPIGNMLVKAEHELPEYFKEIVREELNVKNITFVDDVSEYTGYTFKPQLRTVGPKYGKQLGGIKAYLEQVDGVAAYAELKEQGALTFTVDGTEVSLAEEDLLISAKQVEGFETQSDAKVTVVLDKTLTPELIEEGFASEIISKVQTMRKEAGFEVMDHIRLSLKGNEKLSAILEKNKDSVCTKVLADELLKDADLAVSKEWNINGETAVISVERV